MRNVHIIEQLKLKQVRIIFLSFSFLFTSFYLNFSFKFCWLQDFLIFHDFSFFLYSFIYINKISLNIKYFLFLFNFFKCNFFPNQKKKLPFENIRSKRMVVSLLMSGVVAPRSFSFAIYYFHRFHMLLIVVIKMHLSFYYLLHGNNSFIFFHKFFFAYWNHF